MRNFLKEHRLTFDGMLCVAGALTYWTDPTVNFVQPVFLYSSNYVNLANWCGHMPLVVNPDCGRLPEPVLLNFCIYAFGLLLFAMMIGAGMRWARRRWPSLSTAKLIALAAAGGLLVDIALELPMYRLQLASYAGVPDEFAIWGTHGYKYPLVEAVWGGAIAMGIALTRFFKDDAGRTIVERGLERPGRRARRAISLLALTAVTHLLSFFGNGGSVALGFFSDPYRERPAYVVNDM